MRIVSLVPSLTETMFHFGLGASLVGRTRYCEEPVRDVARVEAVGGTKNPDVARIIELKPDVVLLNREENRLEDSQALQAGGLRVYASHPRTVAEAIVMLEELGQVVNAVAAADDLAQRCREALAAVRAMGADRPSVFCPIWRKPWMTFRRQTYIGDVLDLTCGANAFGSHETLDFFALELDAIRAAKPDLVVLPDEPYAFDDRHARELREAGIGTAHLCVDGKDLSWYGPRIPGALERLAAAARNALN